MPYSDDDCDARLIVVKIRRKARTVDHENQTDTELVTETLVEEVSIDGMCGVY
jgi:mycofactocin precursor peptide MftA